MTIIIPDIFGNFYSYITLMILVITSSYIVIPGIGGIIVAYAANSSGINNYIITFILVYIASLIGDISVFLIVRRYSNRVLIFLQKRKWYNRNEKHARKLLDKYGFIIVFTSRFFFTGVGTISNYICGLTRFNPKKFIIAVVTGEFIYALLYTGSGYFFKDTWTYLIGLVQNFSWAILLILIGVYLLYRIIKLLIQKEIPQNQIIRIRKKIKIVRDKRLQRKLERLKEKQVKNNKNY
jgi:membrane protein DedA with SNARE-associated domain